MRFLLALSTFCAVAVTSACILLLITRGEDYGRRLALAPSEMRTDLASRRRGIVRRVEEILWRFQDRKRAALLGRVLEASEKVFTASPQTAHDMRHLRRMAASRLMSDPWWVRLGRPGRGYAGRSHGLSWLELNPDLTDRPALDAARAFWETAQEIYDAEGRARLRDPLLRSFGPSLEQVPLEARLRARRAGCGFLAAGMRLGMEHDEEGLGGRGCAQEASESLRCLPSAAERVARAYRGGLPVDPVDCAELERAAAGDPLSAEGTRSTWDAERCRKNALVAVAAPGWRDSAALCAEAQARAKARGLSLALPLQ